MTPFCDINGDGVVNIYDATAIQRHVAEFDDEKHPAVTSIGSNPTFNGETVTVETHIMDYSGDCYGKPFTVVFIERLRPMKRFDSVSELKAQIASDTERAREIIRKTKYTE